MDISSTLKFLCLCTHVLSSAVIMSNVSVSSFLLFSGVGDSGGAGGVAEGGAWGGGGRLFHTQLIA